MLFRSEAVRSFAATRPTPPDWVYVHNFAEPDRPRAFPIPTGPGRRLAIAMMSFLEALQRKIPRAYRERGLRAATRAVPGRGEYAARHADRRTACLCAGTRVRAGDDAGRHCQHPAAPGEYARDKRQCCRHHRPRHGPDSIERLLMAASSGLDGIPDQRGPHAMSPRPYTPHGSPSRYHTARKIVHNTMRTSTYGSIKATTVPTPAPFWYF